MITLYTREAGVRGLERKIGQICRKAARELMENGADKVVVNTKNLDKFLGKSTYSYLMANKKDEVGIARGLAWTQVGGDTLQIEVNVMPGKGELVLTGQLGDVMKESAMAGIFLYPFCCRPVRYLNRNFSRKMTFTYISRRELSRRMVRLRVSPWRQRCFLRSLVRKCAQM